MAKLRIRHVRETLARLFYRYARVRVYRASEREGERRRGRRRERKKEAAKERARGQHYPAIKSLAVKKRITQWHCAVTVRNEYQRNTSRMLSLSLSRSRVRFTRTALCAHIPACIHTCVYTKEWGGYMHVRFRDAWKSYDVLPSRHIY